jgi:hypothetical protein
MNIKVPLVIVATSLLACSATVTADPSCANLPGLKLTVKKYSIDLNDNRPVCITVPGEFKITINNPPGGDHTVNGGDVTVRQKVEAEDATVLINGANESPVNKLTVEVKLVEGKSFDEYDEFEFWIDVEGVGILDPRIKVVPGDELLMQQINAVEATLDSWGETYEDFEKIRKEVDAY